jgi:transposase-like protein
VHRCRNLLAKVPTHAQDEVKQAFWQIFDDITAEAGEAAVAEACRRATASAKRYRDRYPAAVACLPARADHVPEVPAWALGKDRPHQPDRADLRA